MNISPLLLCSIAVIGLWVGATSCLNVESAYSSLEVEPPTAEIEERVAQVMDGLEVLKEEEEQISNGSIDREEGPGQSIVDVASESDLVVSDEPTPADKNPVEVGTSVSDETATDEKADDVELIEEAQDNRFTFLSLFFGKYYESVYEKINKYLVDKLEENDNTKDNMESALEWLSSLEGNSFMNGNLIKALKQFTSLTKIEGENMCTRNSYGILRKNDLATRGNAHKRITKLGAMRRVDKIVYEYSIQHAIDCFREYPRKFAIKRAQLDQTQLSYVEPLFDHIFQTILRPSSFLGIFSNPDRKKNVDPTEVVRDIRSLNRADVGEATLERMRYYARNDPDNKYLDFVNDDRSGKYIIRDDKVKELYEKYIVKPCEYYIEQLGFDILIPMRFDLQMLEPEDRYLLNNDQVIDFYTGYARFRACNLLVFQDRKALARQVVKAVHKQSVPISSH